jgi:exosortase H (IPTLxxWG-CTERM-specific)
MLLTINYRDIYYVTIEPWNGILARLSYWLLHWVDTDVSVENEILYSLSHRKAVRVERGCNGVEAVAVLAAAILAYPTTMKAKILGLILGALAVQSLNVIRIVALYYLNIWNEALFEWTHLYLWQLLLILDAFVFFVLWLRWAPFRKVA